MGIQFSGRICALALGLFALTGPARAECKIEQVGELPVKVGGDRILVDAMLDGKPAEMIVDTGSPFTFISKKAADRLGLKPHLSKRRYYVGGVGGDGIPLIAGVRELTFGHYALTNDTVFVANLDHDGILGRDVFRGFDVEVDLAHGAIRLLHPVGCQDAQMIYWGGTSYAEAPLEQDQSFDDDYRTQISLNGRTFAVIMDTGAPTTTVTPNAARAAGASAVASASAIQTGGFGLRTVSAYPYLFKKVGVGDEVVSNVDLLVTDLWKYNTSEETGTRLGATDTNPNYGLLGLDFFQANRVLISPSHHKALFTYLGGPVFHGLETIKQADRAAPPLAVDGGRPQLPPVVPPAPK